MDITGRPAATYFATASALFLRAAAFKAITGTPDILAGTNTTAGSFRPSGRTYASRTIRTSPRVSSEISMRLSGTAPGSAMPAMRRTSAGVTFPFRAETAAFRSSRMTSYTVRSPGSDNTPPPPHAEPSDLPGPQSDVFLSKPLLSARYSSVVRASAAASPRSQRFIQSMEDARLPSYQRWPPSMSVMPKRSPQPNRFITSSASSTVCRVPSKGKTMSPR